ncbi:hypothetical protein JXB01_03000 [Candidatus Micrarchaeota archaeon]|nr:hypothetical protein [Candidatus Micrarchaeota archaeon]
MHSLDFAVKYPFSRISKELLSSRNIVPNERIMEMAVSRILDSINKGVISRKEYADELSKIEEIASYAASRMILSYMRNAYLTNKYAVAESKRASSIMQSSREPEGDADALASEFGITFLKYNDSFFVHFASYLKYSPGSLTYKLINRNIKEGFVQVSRSERIRLLEEAVRLHIQKMPIFKLKNRSDVISASKKIISELPRVSPKKISLMRGDNPPCIENLLDDLMKHKNLNHPSRWYLAVYLVNAGLETEKILDIFSNSPDYSEKITKYQVEHAKKRGYVVPSCSTVKGYGLCTADCRIGNPVNWRGKRK